MVNTSKKVYTRALVAFISFYALKLLLRAAELDSPWMIKALKATVAIALAWGLLSIYLKRIPNGR